MTIKYYPRLCKMLNFEKTCIKYCSVLNLWQVFLGDKKEHAKLTLGIEDKDLHIFLFLQVVPSNSTYNINDELIKIETKNGHDKKHYRS